MKTKLLTVMACRGAIWSLPQLTALLWLAFTLPAAAISLQLGFTAPNSFNESNRQAVLEWNAEPARTYLVQSATNLSPGTIWKTEEPVRAAAVGPVKWMAPEALRTQKFYRLILPRPEVFAVEPSFVNSDDPAALFYLIGQCFPTNGSVVINGLNFNPTLVDSNGSWMAISLNGLPPGTPVFGNILVLDDASNIVTTLPLANPVIHGTELTAEQLQGPPDEPPASPEALLGTWLSRRGYDYYKAGSDLNAAGLQSNPYFVEIPMAGDMSMSARKGYQYYKAHSDLNAAGLHANPFFQENANAGEMPMHAKRGYDYYQAKGALAFEVQEGKKGLNAVNVKLARTAPGSAPAAGISGGVVAGVVVAKLSSGELQSEETDLAIPGRGLDFAWTRTYRSRTGPDTAQGAGWDFSYNVSLTSQPDGTMILRPGNGRADTFYLNGTNGWARDEYFVEIRDLNGDGMPDVLFADTGRWLFKPLGTPAGGKLWQIIDRNGNTMTLDYNLKGQLTTIVDDLGRTNLVGYGFAGKIASVTDFSGRVVRYEYDGNGDLVACVSPSVTGTPTGNDFPGGITNRYTYTSGNFDDRLNHNLTSCVDGKGQTSLQVFYQSTNDPASLDFDTVATLQRGIDKKDIRRGMVIAKPGNSYATVQAIVNDYMGNVTEWLFDSRQRCVSMREFTGRANPALPTTATENRPTGKLRADDPDYFETQWEWNADSLRTATKHPAHLEVPNLRYVYERDFNFSASPRKKGDCRIVRVLAGTGGGDLDGDGAPDITELAAYFEYDPRFGSPAEARKVHGIHHGENQPMSFGKKLYVGNLPYMESARGPRQTISLDGSYGPDPRNGRFGRPAINTALNHRYFGAGQLPRLELWDFVVSTTDPRRITSTADYDASGNRVKVKFPSLPGAQEDFAYNSFGQCTAVTKAADGNGHREVTFTSFATSGPQNGYVQSITEDAGGLALTTGYECDVRGNVTRVLDPRGNDALFAYNALDQCVRAQTPTNRLSRFTTDYRYDGNGNMVEDVVEYRDADDGPGHLRHRFRSYDSLDRVASVAEQVSPGVFVTNRFFHDANSQLTLIESPLAVSGADPHNSVAFEYDECGLLFREIGAPGGGSSPTNEYSYDPVGKLRSGVIAEVGSGRPATVGRYDGLGRLVSVTDPLSNVVSYVYDRNGNLTLTRYFGETNDMPGSTGNRLLAETRFAYDLLDHCVQQVDSFFDISTLAAIGDGQATTTFAYAPNGDCASVTDDNNHITRFVYDTAGRVASVTDPKSNVVNFTYDECDNILSVTRSDRSDLTPGLQQFTVVRAYDKLHRLTRSVDNVGNTNRYAYDSLDNLVSAVDARGNEAVRAYDDLSRCIQTTCYQGIDRGITISTTHVEYDVNSRCISATDANANTTAYAYDSLDHHAVTTNADGTRQKLVWSPRSNLVRTEDANGTVITNVYDLCDRLIHRDIVVGGGVASSTTFESFAYDGLSRLVAATNDGSVSTFDYDSLGNCTRSVSGGLGALTTTQDGVGNRLSMTYPSGRLVTYTYNALDEVASVSSGSGGLPPTTLATFDYEGPGRVGRVSRANNVNTRVQWDGLMNPPNSSGDFGWGQVKGINHQVAGGGAVIDQRRATYDQNQNKTLRAQTAPFYPGGDTTTNVFEYDPLDRLSRAIAVKGTGATLRTYVLDGNDNRQLVSSNGVVETYQMEATIPPADFQMNQYTLTPFGSQSFDENGNLVVMASAAGPTFYHYDYADRLVEVDALNGGGLIGPVASFTYDALGRRSGKTTYPPQPLAPVTTQFVYGSDEDCDTIIEGHENGALKFFAVWPHMHQAGTHMRISAAGAILYAHADDLGNILALTDASGNVVERYEYDDFGLPQFLTSDGFPSSASSSVVGNPFLFHGMEWDAEISLYHDRGMSGENPFYDPKTGRAINNGMPNRISMNVTVPKQTQGATFGEKVNQGLHAAGGALNNPWRSGGGGSLVLKKEEGGRHTPFHNKYRPQFLMISGSSAMGGDDDDGGWSAAKPRDPWKTYWERHSHTTGHVTLIK